MCNYNKKIVYIGILLCVILSCSNPSSGKESSYSISILSSGRHNNELLESSVSLSVPGKLIGLDITLESSRKVELKSNDIEFDSSTIYENCQIDFIMPESDVEIVADFQDVSSELFNINILSINAESGETVTSDKIEASEGVVINLSPCLNSNRSVYLESDGINFSKPVLTKNENVSSFVMPSRDIEVNAEFNDMINVSNTGFTNSVGFTKRYVHNDFDFSMKYCPGLIYPSGSNVIIDIDVKSSYLISETELTYPVWFAIYSWAVSKSEKTYHFDNPGREGGTSIDGGTPIHSMKPVTKINWRDSIVFCNAMTEYFNVMNGLNMDLPYVDSSGNPIRDSRDSNAPICDNAVFVESSTGFRLPSIYEWELAAKYIGTENNSNNSGILKSGIYWIPGEFASGSISAYDDLTPYKGTTMVDFEFGRVAVYSTTRSSSVKTKVDGMNQIGCYDMSGNIQEWCFDTKWNQRASHGGDYSNRPSVMTGWC